MRVKGHVNIFGHLAQYLMYNKYSVNGSHCYNKIKKHLIVDQAQDHTDFPLTVTRNYVFNV